MDDINARRDARRRRILENSNKRLQKITGLSDDTESEDASSQTSFMHRGIQEDKPQQSVNGTISEKYYDGIKDTNISEPRNVCNNMFVPLKDDYNNIRTETEEVNSTFMQTRISRPLLRINRLNYIFTALVVNVMLALELDYLFGKSVVAPYLTVLLIRLYNCISTRAVQDGNLLYTALILCNVQPKVSRRLNLFAAILYMAIEDLALYIFSFTAIHYTFFYKLHKTDTVTVLNI